MNEAEQKKYKVMRACGELPLITIITPSLNQGSLIVKITLTIGLPAGKKK